MRVRVDGEGGERAWRGSVRVRVRMRMEGEGGGWKVRVDDGR